MKPIYFDYNATTPLFPEVVEEMRPYFEERFGNLSSLHWAGRGVGEAVEAAREKVGRLVGARTREVVFTSSGTEADNLALMGSVRARAGRGSHIVTTRVEHPAVRNTARRLSQDGIDVTWIPVNEDGRLDAQKLIESVRPDTVLVSVMLANNESGTLFPVEEISGEVRKRGAWLHVDAVQAVGKIDVRMNGLGADLLSVSSHKIHGPKGVGSLCVRRGVKLEPVLMGGGQEWGLRPGTENVPAIVGFGKAAEITMERYADGMEKIKALRDRLETGILEAVDRVVINGDTENRLANTSNLSFSGVEGESLLMGLDLEGIAISTGSACSSSAAEPSHVLLAMGRSAERSYEAVRFSLGFENTEDEVDRVLNILPGVVRELRRRSPGWSGR